MSPDLRAPRRRGTAPARRSAARRSAAALTLSAVAVVLVGGCSGRDLALPEATSDRADYVSQLWLGAWIAAGVVGVFVFALMVWAIVRYRRRSDDEVPAQVRYNLPIEVLYTVAPIIVVLVFFFHTIQTGQDLLDDCESVDHEVQVLGQKWSWSFSYLEEDAIGGESVYTAGTPADRPTLVLPLGECVDFTLTSQDVVHAFWVPAFYFKEDVIPGRANTFSLTPTREGTYEGRCSELCGTYHSRMLFDLEVVSPEEFDAHLRELQAAGNVGVLEPSSDVTEIAGEESTSEEEGP